MLELAYVSGGRPRLGVEWAAGFENDVGLRSTISNLLIQRNKDLPCVHSLWMIGRLAATQTADNW